MRCYVAGEDWGTSRNSSNLTKQMTLTRCLPASISILVLLVVPAGCQPVEISLAPIHEVRVNIAESYPPQVFVYIKGGLRDGCTTFHDLSVTRSGNTVNIKVTTQRPRNAICTQVYGFFEKTVNLGSDFTAGMTHMLKVNEVSTNFTVR